MPRSTRSLLSGPLAAVALGTLLLAGPGVAPAAAKTKHAPCPTTGTTIVTAGAPNLRVWHEGSTLRACTRVPGQRRHLRTLGAWSTTTKVAAGAGNVAWTTAREIAGGTADDVRTTDVRTGTSWLKTARAAVAPDAATPASDDRVLRLVTDDTATAWVSARGVIAVAVRRLDPDEPGSYYGAGVPATTPYRAGRRFFLGETGPAAAPAVASGLRLDVSSDGDECGGSTFYAAEVPAWGSRPEMSFHYLTRDDVSDHDYCR